MVLWIAINHSTWTMQVGQVGCLVVEHELDYQTKEVVGWQLHWHEQCDYQYSEGLRLEPDSHRFLFTDEGLEQAKQAGIEFARRLLNEALSALE